MSRAFTKDDPKPEDKDAIDAYERHRIAQLGGGDYEKGKAFLEAQKRDAASIRTTRPTFRKAKKKATR